MYEAVDHQITLDPGGRNSRLLYEAARTGEPLVKQAATRLAGAVSDGDHVLIATGFPITPERPETDGPLGAVVLADALAALGAEPVFVIEPMARQSVEAVVVEYGVDSWTTETVDPESTATVGDEQAVATDLLDGYEPAAVVAVEKPGRTADGTHRNMVGEDISDHVGGVDALFERAADRGVLTVAVGDGGNEIGMGAVRSAVEGGVDHGETIACVTSVDVLVVAGVSNWGAYGVVAGLSLLTGDELLHSGVTERDILAACVEAGSVDGVSGAAAESVDGIPGPVHARVVDILRHCCSTD